VYFRIKENGRNGETAMVISVTWCTLILRTDKRIIKRIINATHTLDARGKRRRKRACTRMHTRKCYARRTTRLLGGDDEDPKRNPRLIFLLRNRDRGQAANSVPNRSTILISLHGA